jgi:hypothetical protein
MITMEIRIYLPNKKALEEEILKRHINPSLLCIQASRKYIKI